MMRRAIRSLAVTSALVAVSAASAWAIPNPYNNASACGGNEFKTCAALNISWVGTTATIQIRNLGTLGETFTAFGFRNLPQGTTITSSTVDPALASRFTAGDINDLQGLGFFANNPSPQNGLKAGDGGPFTFIITFGGAFTPASIAGAEFGIHAQTGPNGCSTKLFVSPTGVVNDQGDFPNPACATTVIPEPITMTLLASGLAGIGGVGALRRRRKV